MKVLLVLSLVVNVILGVLYLQEKSRPPLERFILEKSVPPVSDKAVMTRTEHHSPKKTPHPKTAMMVSPADPEMDRLAEVVGEQVRNDRLAFLTEKLNLSQQDLDKIEKIKDHYYRNLQKVSTSDGMPSLDQRRQALDIEAKRDQEFMRLMGRKNWEKFKKFRVDYNQRKFEEHAGDYGVVVPLDI